MTKSKYPKRPLGELIKIKHGYAFKSEYFADAGKFILLTPGNFHEAGGFRERPGKDRFYIGEFPEEYLLEFNDLIVAMTEQGEGLLGSTAFIPSSGIYLHNQRLGLITIKNPIEACNKYLFYLFNTSSVRQQIRGSSSGTKVRHTSPERIYKVQAEIPPLPVQRKIAAILSAYDDLIENCDRRITLLEKMAEEIYREWFVRLRFPGHEQTTFHKGIPEGWELVKIGALCKEIRKGVNVKSLGGDTKYLGLEHLPRKSILIRDFGSIDSVQSNKLLFQKRDILFGKIRPYLHKIVLADFVGACSSDTIVIRPNQLIYEGFLLFTIFSDTFVELATISSKGTKMPRADWDFLKKLEIILPSHKLLEKYQSQFEGYFFLMSKLVSAKDNLRQTRDRLLTRLISGKLSVEDLDIQFPPSMTSAEEEP